MLAKTPHVVPAVVELHIGIVPPKTLPVLAGGKYPFVQINKLIRRIECVERFDISFRKRLVIDLYLIDESVERVGTREGIFPYRIGGTTSFAPAYLNVLCRQFNLRLCHALFATLFTIYVEHHLSCGLAVGSCNVMPFFPFQMKV